MQVEGIWSCTRLLRLADEREQSQIHRVPWDGSPPKPQLVSAFLPGRAVVTLRSPRRFRLRSLPILFLDDRFLADRF
jgi:hypothetical protein